jgi:hypothetical protein
VAVVPQLLKVSAERFVTRSIYSFLLLWLNALFRLCGFAIDEAKEEKEEKYRNGKNAKSSSSAASAQGSKQLRVQQEMGAILDRITAEQFREFIQHSMTLYEREIKQLNLLLFPEILDHLAYAVRRNVLAHVLALPFAHTIVWNWRSVGSRLVAAWRLVAVGG